MHDHARLVLQPKVATALVAKGEAVAALRIGAGELRDAVKFVDLAGGTNGRRADAADTEAADSERIGPTTVIKRDTSTAAAPDEGSLNLLHLDGPVGYLAGYSVRTGRA